MATKDTPKFPDGNQSFQSFPGETNSLGEKSPKVASVHASPFMQHPLTREDVKKVKDPYLDPQVS